MKLADCVVPRYNRKLSMRIVQQPQSSFHTEYPSLDQTKGSTLIFVGEAASHFFSSSAHRLALDWTYGEIRKARTLLREQEAVSLL